MASNSTWAIVEFVEDGTVEAVPSNWIDGDRCYWPNLPRSRMTQAIKKCEAVQASWPVHSIKHFENATYDDYARARLMAIRAEETSDLQSDPEHRDKRRKIAKRFSSSEDESLQKSSSLPRAPKMKTNNIGTSVSATILTPLPSLASTTCNSTLFEEGGGSNASSEGNPECATVLTPLTPVFNCNSTQEESGGSNASSGGNAEARTNQEIMVQLKILITQNHLLRAITCDTQERLRKMEDVLDIIVGNGQRREIYFFNKFNYLEFPVNSLQNQNNLETILQDGQNFEDAVNEISKFGDKNNYDFVKRAMTTLITNKMALKFSWLGRKGKLVFSTTLMAKLVICAAEKTKIEGCRKTTEGNIQMWLKRAYDRQHTQQKNFA